MYYKDPENNLHSIESTDFAYLLPAGSVQITDEEAAKIAKPKLTKAELQAQKNAESLAYLASTDWYVVRFAESGVAVPADIATKRKEARDAIV